VFTLKQIAIEERQLMQPRRYLRTLVVLLVLDLLVASWFGFSENRSWQTDFAMMTHLLISV
jgi:hypothetical protein